ncbi:hypothetical protein NP233_g2450 [Leucocoprinus birnbaumii]|uniref:Protein root UVB sensitive/RUS domain-containing protein n=1 Tax=Leucocoprinus birnbaumii TaxID=56174 RepID=A0AAD5VYZ3_9AGAR|nr:hypothetical protein NP233_g2450 [Leucocoprinus birnbaumii]
MAKNAKLVLAEKDGTNKKRELWVSSDMNIQILEKQDLQRRKAQHQGVRDLLEKVFLPAGYPKTVTPASLLASRAVLEGIGVGDSSATATQAMLLSVLRDAFGRIATIVGAYYLGTSLISEAKTYRILADVLNDLGVVIDVLAPVLNTLFFPGAIEVGLCTSAALKALCGIVAGGSKTAITLHFATPVSGLGDLGDLNAKDSSKETVLALMGMLLGSLIVPLITSMWATYASLFILVGLHLIINYYGVRGVALRQLNKQRAAIAWLHYKTNKKAPTPQQVAEQEYLFDQPGIIRDLSTHRIIGQYHMGSAPLDVLRGPFLSSSFLQIFESQKYLLCFQTDPVDAIRRPDQYPIIHVCFREDFTPEDQTMGWIHAVEICRLITSRGSSAIADFEALLQLIASTLRSISSTSVLSEFQEELKRAGWNTSESHVMSGSGPKALLVTAALAEEQRNETRKC